MDESTNPQSEMEGVFEEKNDSGAQVALENGSEAIESGANLDDFTAQIDKDFGELGRIPTATQAGPTVDELKKDTVGESTEGIPKQISDAEEAARIGTLEGRMQSTLTAMLKDKDSGEFFFLPERAYSTFLFVRDRILGDHVKNSSSRVTLTQYKASKLKDPDFLLRIVDTVLTEVRTERQTQDTTGTVTATNIESMLTKRRELEAQARKYALVEKEWNADISHYNAKMEEVDGYLSKVNDDPKLNPASAKLYRIKNELVKERAKAQRGLLETRGRLMRYGTDIKSIDRSLDTAQSGNYTSMGDLQKSYQFEASLHQFRSDVEFLKEQMQPGKQRPGYSIDPENIFDAMKVIYDNSLDGNVRDASNQNSPIRKDALKKTMAQQDQAGAALSQQNMDQAKTLDEESRDEGAGLMDYLNNNAR